MTGILYFSSTGNSLYIAKAVQKEIPGRILYIPHYEGDGSEFDRIVIVCPIYSFGLPKHVYDLIPRLSKQPKIDFVLNYGGASLGADYFTYQYAQKHGVNIHSVHTIKMVENFSLHLTVPKFYRDDALRQAPKRISKVVAALKADARKLPAKKKTFESTYQKNKGNWHKIADDFHVTADCISCGKCVSVCPAQNIALENGKISFSDKCVACLGCYHRCPKQAIRYRNKVKKFRYVNPNIDENEIGMNL